MQLPEAWSKLVVVGWFLFFGLFLGTDIYVWITGDPRIPTFSRVVCKTLPWWIVIPLTMALTLHFTQIFIESK